MTQPGLVRLLFLAFVLYWLAAEVIRKDVRAVYPGLYLPAFNGIGLEKMKAGTGQVLLTRITVRFAEGSPVVLASKGFFGEDFYTSVLPSRVFAAARAAGHAGAPVPADARDFIAARARKLFPGRTPTSVTFQLVRVSFPLDRPSDQTVLGVADELIIPLTP